MLPLKRRHSPEEISPPPIRRKLLPTASGSSTTGLATPTSTTPTASIPQNHLRIYSWNVNGIAPFLQPSIRKYFTSTTTTTATSTAMATSTPQPLSPPAQTPASASSIDASPNASAPALAHHAPYSLRNILHRWSYPSIVCLQEVKIASRDEGSKKALERAFNPPSAPAGPLVPGLAKDEGPSYVVRYCLPRDRFNARGFGGKMYGVCCAVRRDVMERYAVRFREVEWDMEGRVLVCELQWREEGDEKPGVKSVDRNEDAVTMPNHSINTESSADARGDIDPTPPRKVTSRDPSPRKLAVINGYWPNGTTNPYKSPTTGRATGTTRHDHKRLFHAQMLAETQRLERDGWHVVLIGDMNISRSALDGHPGLRLGVEHVRNRGDFEEKFLSQGKVEGGMRGVDAFRWLHGPRRKFTYYGRGVEWGSSCDRVDLVVLSRGLVGGNGREEGHDGDGEEKRKGALVASDILDSSVERGHSDHVPLFVALITNKIPEQVIYPR